MQDVHRSSAASLIIALREEPARFGPVPIFWLTLGLDDQLVAVGLPALEGVAEDLLARADGVHVRGVKPVEAEVERVLDHLVGPVLADEPGTSPAVEVAEAHASDADAGDVEPAPAELLVFHAVAYRRGLEGQSSAACWKVVAASAIFVLSFAYYNEFLITYQSPYLRSTGVSLGRVMKNRQPMTVMTVATMHAALKEPVERRSAAVTSGATTSGTAVLRVPQP